MENKWADRQKDVAATDAAARLPMSSAQDPHAHLPHHDHSSDEENKVDATPMTHVELTLEQEMQVKRQAFLAELVARSLHKKETMDAQALAGERSKQPFQRWFGD